MVDILEEFFEEFDIIRAYMEVTNKEKGSSL